MSDVLWSQGRTYKRLHAWRLHPLNKEYMWSACGMLYGTKVLTAIDANSNLKRCMTCAIKAAQLTKGGA